MVMRKPRLTETDWDRPRPTLPETIHGPMLDPQEKLPIAIQQSKGKRTSNLQKPEDDFSPAKWDLRHVLCVWWLPWQFSNGRLSVMVNCDAQWQSIVYVYHVHMCKEINTWKTFINTHICHIYNIYVCVCLSVGLHFCRFTFIKH